jgi:hypothetical protein
LGIFFGLVTAASGILFSVVHPPPKSVGKLVVGDDSGYPLQACLEAVLGQRVVCQLTSLYKREKKSALVIFGE